jgi:uncharacterized cupin superfamily protein
MPTSLGIVVPEAPLEQNAAGGAYPSGEGWFVVNARDAQWFDSVELGLYAPFEGEHARFEQLGINLSILRPGEPACMYHAEEAQEGFLLLSGEALLVVEGQERQLRRWDYVHCPPWTEHVVIGAGDAPCVLLSVGARKKGRGIVYPVKETASRHGASVEVETSVPAEAYARYEPPTPTGAPELP